MQRISQFAYAPDACQTVSRKAAASLTHHCACQRRVHRRRIAARAQKGRFQEPERSCRYGLFRFIDCSHVMSSLKLKKFAQFGGAHLW
jgi:hypothetical protein